MPRCALIGYFFCRKQSCSFTMRSDKLNVLSVVYTYMTFCSIIKVDAIKSAQLSQKSRNDNNVYTDAPGNVFVDTKYLLAEDYLMQIPDMDLRNWTRLLLRVCPDTDFCGHQIKDAGASLYGCCVVCSCDIRSCHDKSNCCPHVAHEYASLNSTTKPANSTCKHAAILREGEQDNGDEYYFTSCLAEADQGTRKACEELVDGTSSFSFADVTPVSDKMTGRNYFNRHCAACHNVSVENRAFWVPRISCMDPVSVTDLAEGILKRKDCQIEFDPPEGMDTNSSLCFSKEISECNTTGRWATYDSETELACHQYAMRYTFTTIKKEKKIYSNVFCAFCNGEDVYINLGVSACEVSDITRFFTLLVSVDKPEVPDTTPDSQTDCDGGMELDPVNDRCKSLHCTRPMMLVPHEGMCAYVVEYISSTLYHVPFRVSLLDKVLTLTSAGNITAVLLDQIFMAETTNVKLCSAHFYFKLNYFYKPTSHLSSLLPVKDVYIIVNLRVRFTSTPETEFQRIIDTIATTTIKLNHTVMNIGHGYLDGKMQTPIGLPLQAFSNVTLSPSLSWFSNTIVGNAVIFEDPYDHMTVVEGLEYPDDIGCDNPEASFYDTGFLNCSAFLYEIKHLKIKRVQRGLLLQNKIIKFGSFQSLNESHVLVCVDAVNAMFASSKGNIPLHVDIVLLVVCVMVNIIRLIQV